MVRLAELYLLSQGLSYVLKRQSNILITWAKPKWAEELKNQENSSKNYKPYQSSNREMIEKGGYISKQVK